jgi:2-iminobutanoate/2-iminopropanoate deaminase
MSKKIIQSSDAPAPIGPYSQAVSANGFLFCSGQIAINPKTGKLVTESIKAETEQVMRNILAVLQADGKDFSNVIKTSIFLKSMDDFAEVNRVYSGYFETEPPARETVAVRTLPKDVNVEISVIAY